MVANLYVIKDSTTDTCTPVFQQVNNNAAIRHFNGYLRAMPLYMRPDFSLWVIASIDGVHVVGHDPVVVLSGEAVPFPGEDVTNG